MRSPYIEHLRGRKSLNAAITAAIVGVVMNLSIWFALHTLFGIVDERHLFGASLLVPDWFTLDVAASMIAVGAFVALFVFKRGMIVTIPSRFVRPSWATQSLSTVALPDFLRTARERGLTAEEIDKLTKRIRNKRS